MFHRIVTFLLFICLSFSVSSAEYLRIEIHCEDNFKRVSLSDLCKKNLSCEWEKLQSSATAASWQREAGNLIALEIPNEQKLRLKFFRGEKKVQLPWCSKSGSKAGKATMASWEKLNQKDLSLLISKKGTLYLLPTKPQGKAIAIWKMLHEIEHPCRTLIKVKMNDDFTWLYLRPENKKSC